LTILEIGQKRFYSS